MDIVALIKLVQLMEDFMLLLICIIFSSLLIIFPLLILNTNISVDVLLILLMTMEDAFLVILYQKIVNVLKVGIGKALDAKKTV